MKSLRALAVLPFLFLAACSGSADEGLADEGEASEDAVRASGLVVTCEWNEVPDLMMLSGSFTTYKLTIKDTGTGTNAKPSKATGEMPGEEGRPDNWVFAKMEGSARLYTMKAAKIPERVTEGKFEVVPVLNVPGPLAKGKAGKITIKHYVQKNGDLTPLVGSEEEPLIRAMEEGAADGGERVELAVTTELVTSTLGAKCKKP